MFNAINSNAIVSKSKNIFWTFFCISGIYVKFQTLSRKSWSSRVISHWNYTLEKAELLKWPKSSVSENLWTINMLKGAKHRLNPHGSIFVIVFDHSEKKSASKTLFQKCLKSWGCFLTYLHPMTSILSQEKRVFNATNSNVIISKPKKIFSIFSGFPESP